ncbi:asparaginyl-tRNA synthetase [Dorcoceras hygrometricum]|nr:asparaginyl-tRNA synthetase [Dorcoceras hygrometricum]
MTSALMSSQSADEDQQMKRSAKMKRRRVKNQQMERSAREEATSYGDSADGLEVDDVIGDVIQSQDSAGSLLSRRKMKRRRRGSSRKLQCNQQMLLEIAIAKRCRLHKLVRQRFALALIFSRKMLRWKYSADAKIQQVAAVLPVESLFVSAVATLPVVVRSSRKIQSQDSAEEQEKQKRQKPAKEKDASTFTLQRSVAPKWKEDKTAFWSAEEFLEAFQREDISAEAIYWRQRPLKKCPAVQSERDAMRSFSWCIYILWEIFIDYTVHQQRENNLK